MFILISILILLIIVFIYIIIKYLIPVNDIIPEMTTMSEIQKKKQQLYDEIYNKFLYPNQTTTTIPYYDYNIYSIWNKTTSNITSSSKNITSSSNNITSSSNNI